MLEVIRATPFSFWGMILADMKSADVGHKDDYVSALVLYRHCHTNPRLVLLAENLEL